MALANGTRRAMVTGASYGIGAATAIGLAEDGFDVAVTDLAVDSLAATLARIAPDASEHLRIAARGQHIERWTSLRKSYPEGRVGYLSWRNELKEFHARRLGEIMLSAGYDGDDIARVRSLVRKERLKFDREAQLLEDVACLVFLEHYLSEFSRKTNQEKLAGILAKTWKKMSPLGHEHALKLAFEPEITALLQQVIAG